MDQLREMQTFLHVVQTRNFSSAARQLGVSRSTVTKLISGLEKRLGVNLLVRSTHHVTVTNTGELFAEEARAILARVDHLHQLIEDENADLKGEIKVGAPPAFAAMHLVRAIGDFRAQYPQVTFEIVSDDGRLNVIKEGLDFSVRIVPALPDMALISKLLARVPQVLVGAPSYLDRRGRPKKPGELGDHACLVHTIKSPYAQWTFDDDEIVAVHGTMKSNNGEALRQAALRAEGLSIHPTYMVHEDMQSGRLERVLSDCKIEEMSIYAVYAEKHFRPQRVMLFLDFLRTWLRAVADWREV